MSASVFRNRIASEGLSIEWLESRRLLAVTPFSLEDVNPTSATYGQMVSPADFAGQTSAWYFAHST